MGVKFIDYKNHKSWHTDSERKVSEERACGFLYEEMQLQLRVCHPDFWRFAGVQSSLSCSLHRRLFWWEGFVLGGVSL